MHSHDRTMIVKLGFADADKKNPLHDWACQYLARDSVAPKIIDAYLDREMAQRISNNPPPNGVTLGNAQVGFDAELEFPISKGQGQYRTTIGFIDVLYRVKLEAEIVAPALERHVARLWVEGHEFRFRHGDWGCWCAMCNGRSRKTKDLFSDYSQAFEWMSRHGSGFLSENPKRPKIDTHFNVLVEIKISDVSVGDLLRQMRFYMDYRKCWEDGSYYTTHFATATAYSMAAEDVQTLEEHGIKHFQLGAGFDKYAEERKSAKTLVPCDSPEL